MTPQREWRLHLGLHKTAATHLQDSLYQQRDLLVGAGISVVPRVASRDASLGRTMCGIGWRGDLPVAVRRWMGAAVLDRLGCAGPVILWSEEHLLGRPEDMLLDPVFPGLERRLRNLAATTQGARRHLFLSIRELSTMLPSIYAQSLRTGPPALEFQDLLQRWLKDPPQWSLLAPRLRLALPADTLTVWALEASATDAQRILAAYTGTNRARDLALPPSPPSDPRPKRLQSLRPCHGACVRPSGVRRPPLSLKRIRDGPHLTHLLLGSVHGLMMPIMPILAHFVRSELSF